jgi:Amt family ammonium transporter
VVAGLVAITPAAGYVGAGGALAIGLGAGGLCYLAVSLVKARLGYDDSLDAFGVHGIGGIWGALATGLWASVAVNPDGGNGLFYGNPRQFLYQAVAVLVSAGYSFGVSYGLFRLVNAAVKLRVSEHDERVGLDLTQHREAGYTLID